MTNQADLSPRGPAGLIETGYEIGQDNIQPSIGPFGLDIHNPVFVISGLTIVAFVFLVLALPEQAGALFEWLLPALTSTFDWFFLVAANIFVLVCVALMISPLGKVRLGGMDAKPDYSYSGWFAMLFAAGMGIGLMFFGVAEPIEHFTTSLADDAGTPDSWAPLAGAQGTRRGAPPRHGRHHLPLGPAPLGDLRDRRALVGAVHLQQGPAAQRSLDVLPDLRRAGLGLDRPRHRYAGGLRDPVRPGHLARHRRRAGERRSRLPVRRPGERRLQGGVDHRHHRDRARLGGLGHGCRRQAAFRDQHDACRAAVAVRHRYRPDGRDRHRLLRQSGRLSRVSADAVQSVRPRRRQLPRRAGRLLLGLVDLLVAVRRDVHRPHQPGPDRARVHLMRAADPLGRLGAVDDRVRRHRRRHAERGLSGRSPTRRWSSSCSACSTTWRWPGSPRSSRSCW